MVKKSAQRHSLRAARIPANHATQNQPGHGALPAQACQPSRSGADAAILMSCTWNTPSWEPGCCEISLACRVFCRRRHVRALMQRMDSQAIAPQPGTGKTQPGSKIYPYLLRHLPIIQANQVWALATTYIAMAMDMVKGFVYLTAVVDVALGNVVQKNGPPLS